MFICLVFVSTSSIDSRNPVAFFLDSTAQVESVETIHLRVAGASAGPPIHMCVRKSHDYSHAQLSTNEKPEFGMGETRHALLPTGSTFFWRSCFLRDAYNTFP
jgi:hypothetical protein